MATPITGIVQPEYGPDTFTDLATMATELEALGIPRFDTATDRDSAIPSPVQGQCCAVAGALYIYNGGWTSTGSGGGGTELAQTTGAITFASGYSVYSSAYVAPTVVKTGNLCTLESGPIAGLSSIASQTYYTWGNLPSGFYPASTHRLGLGAAWGGGVLTPLQLRVNTSGALELVSIATISSVTYIIIPSGLSWRSA